MLITAKDDKTGFVFTRTYVNGGLHYVNEFVKELQKYSSSATTWTIKADMDAYIEEYNVATLKAMPRGEYFTITPAAVDSIPRNNRVYIKGAYNPGTKTYDCTNFADIGYSRTIKTNKLVYVNFTF